VYAQKENLDPHVYLPAVAPPLAIATSWVGEATTNGTPITANIDPAFWKNAFLSNWSVSKLVFLDGVEKANP
jgi:hypothetical protein